MSSVNIGKINTNLAALGAYNTLTSVNKKLIAAQTQISTGLKVKTTSDDPAGYYIARMYERELFKLNRYLSDVETSSSKLTTADSDMSSMVKLLEKMEDKALQAKSGLVTTAQKSALKQEMDQLVLEVKDLAGGLQNLSGVTLAMGLQMNVARTDLTTAGLNILSGTGTAATSKLKISTAAQVSSTLTILSAAIKSLLNKEEKIGAYMVRLDSKADSYAVQIVNKEAQKSVVEDADLATSTMALTKYNILQQSALAMLSQANMAPSSLLSLLSR